MSVLFDRLYLLLQDELERQETVLAVCQAQGEAVRRHDLELLEAKTAALNGLMQEVAQAAGERQRLIEEIGAGHGLAPGNLKLENIVAVAPHGMRDRLAEMRQRLRGILKQTRPVVQANASTLRGALRASNASLQILHPLPASGSAYDSAGMAASRPAGGARIINQQG